MMMSSDTKKLTLPVRTVLDKLTTHTMEEHAIQRKQWFMQALDHIFTIASVDKSLSTQLKGKANEFFKKTKGRPQTWNDGVRIALVVHYALYMQDCDEDHDQTIKKLIDYEKRMSGRTIGAVTINNKISESLGMPGIFEKVPDFLRPILKRRHDRGVKQEEGKRKSQ